jgi:hypothetical protein
MAKQPKDQSGEGQEQKVKTPRAKQPKDQSGEGQEGGNLHFQEWECKVEGGKVKKLAISRECVKVSQEEADAYNQGKDTCGNVLFKMLFLPQ